MDKALFDLFKLVDEPFSRANHLVQRIQDLRNPPLLSDWRYWQQRKPGPR